MARASRTSVLKRKREAEKAEKAARKRAMREMQKDEGPREKESHSGVPTREDLEAYGILPGEDDQDEDGDDDR